MRGLNIEKENNKFSFGNGIIVIAILLIFMIYFNNVDTKGLLTVYCISASVILAVKDHQSTDIVMWRIDHLIVRKTLGFNHPNQFMIAWMGLCIAYLLKAKQHYFLIRMVILILNYIFYVLTASRTEFLLVCVDVVTVVGFRKWLDRTLGPRCKFLLAIIPVILLAVSFFIIYLYQNPLLNSYLSGRPMLYKQFYDSAGISVFGNGGLEDAMFDNSYLQLLLSKGIVIRMMYIAIMYRFVKHNLVDLRFAILLMFFIQVVLQKRYCLSSKSFYHLYYTCVKRIKHLKKDKICKHKGYKE